MSDDPKQDELDRLEREIRRTRQQVEDDEIPPETREAEERHEKGEDLMPRVGEGNPL